MNEIITATYNFLDILDDSDLIKNLTKYKNNLLNNKALLAKIDNIRNLKDDNKLIQGRKEIYEDNDYKMYMKYYNELSLLIMKINHKYKEYTNTTKGCKG
ncbi:MAG: hypothetical protein IKI04_02420 [Bacilli bacterium]|nr:hypothetical protein [Bacilli bacterium]